MGTMQPERTTHCIPAQTTNAAHPVGGYKGGRPPLLITVWITNATVLTPVSQPDTRRSPRCRGDTRGVVPLAHHRSRRKGTGRERMQNGRAVGLGARSCAPYVGKSLHDLGFRLWIQWARVFHNGDSRGLDGACRPANTRRSDTTEASEFPRHDLMTG